MTITQALHLVLFIIAAVLWFSRKAIVRAIRRRIKSYLKAKRTAARKAAGRTAKRAGRSILVTIYNTMLRLA